EPLFALDGVVFAGAIARNGALTLDRLRVEAAEGRLDGSGRVLFAGGRDLALALALRGPGGDAPPAVLQLDGKDRVLAIGLELPGEDALRLGAGRRALAVPQCAR